MARKGMVFTHAFAPNPSCSPSRSLLLTGQETHRPGEAASLYGNLPPNVATFTELLEKGDILSVFPAEDGSRIS
jgi:arylsulfatase A-like enzyme